MSNNPWGPSNSNFSIIIPYYANEPLMQSLLFEETFATQTSAGEVPGTASPSWWSHTPTGTAFPWSHTSVKNANLLHIHCTARPCQGSFSAGFVGGFLLANLEQFSV